MLLAQLVQAAIDWSMIFGPSCGPIGAPCPCDPVGMFGLSLGGQPNCPGSAFTPIAAAYQTQGMWVQADLLQQIRFNGLGSLAALMYLCSAIGGLIGVALGAPPKMYLWFFMGPPMFHFLIGTPYALKGTEWRVADRPQDQRQVWRMAEVGLLNSNWKYKREAVYNDGAPASTVDVSWFFAYYDQVVSHVIQNLTAWTGLYNLRESTQGTRSGVGPSPSESSQLPSAGTGNWLGDRWWLLSNSKWSMVEDITNSKLANPKIRDALATFMASECGDSFMRNMNSSAFLNAMYYKGRHSPGSVFRGTSNIANESYETLFRDMYAQRVPMPRSLRDLLKDHPNEGSSFVYSIAMDEGSPNNAIRERMINSQYIRCPAYLHILIETFRWEAGQIYHQFMISAPAGLDEQWLAYYLLYGWNVRKPDATQPDPSQWPHLKGEELPEFIKNLILVHLIRNEMMIMPTSFTNRKLSTRTTEDSGEGHLRFIATKNKFSEMYQWALMVPHMQGILLYYLSIAFPFCAMMMVIPGYHKVTFTWMTFWLWAKMWDLGFAMVTSLERSVWAMVGNNSAIQGNLPRIAEMSNFGRVSVTACPTSACDTSCLDQSSASCLFSRVELFSGAPGTAPIFGSERSTTDLLSYASFEGAMRIFDRAITIAANLDLDLSNSYYIYIMAGLYFSVPVVVGQLVLGAKSGSASLIGNIIGAVGQEAGRQGSAGHQSDMIYRMKASKAAVGQEAYAKAMRSSGLADKAIGHGNEQIMAGMNRAGLEAAAGGARAISQAAQLTKGNAEAFSSAGMAVTGAALKTLGGVSSAIGRGVDGQDKRIADRAKAARADGQHAEKMEALRALRSGSGSAGSGTGGTAGGSGLLDSNGNEQNLQQVLPLLPGGAGGVAEAGAGTFQRAMGSAWAQTGLTAAADITGALRNVGMLPYQQFGSNAEMGAQLLQSQSAIQGFGYGQQGTLQGASENRVGAQAEFDARQAAWDAENAYSNQFAALSTALGFFAGGLEAGSKPVDRMGMAMSGDFGAKTQENARAVTPGSWMWNRVSGMQGSINAQYGPQAALNAYMLPELSDMYSFTGGVVAKGGGIAVPFDLTSQPKHEIPRGEGASEAGSGGATPLPVKAP